MTKSFTPEQPHGVLYDANGNITLRFGNFETGTDHQLPDYVETNHAPDYVSAPDAHDDAGYPLEVDPEHPDLPDPAAPPADDNPAPEFTL